MNFKYTVYLKGHVVNRNNQIQGVTIRNVIYSPDLLTNLYSLTKASENNWKVTNEKRVFVVAQKEGETSFTRFMIPGMVLFL